MLSIKVYRGWISGDDVGNNDSYYLYLSCLFRTVSSSIVDWNVIVMDIASHGGINYYGVNEIGGVQFIELCYEFR